MSLYYNTKSFDELFCPPVSVPRARRQAEETTLAPEVESITTEDTATETPPSGGDDTETLTVKFGLPNWAVDVAQLI